MTLIGIEKKRLKKHRILKVVFFIVICLIALILVGSNVQGLSEFEQIEWYKNNSGLLTNNNFVATGLRAIGWGFTKLLVMIAVATEKLWDISFGLIDFTKSKTINNFIESFKPLLVGIMALSFVWLGIILMLSRDKKPKVVINFIILLIVVTSSTTFFSLLNSAVITFKDEVGGNKKLEVYEIIDNNLLDLVKVDNSGGSGTSRIRQLNYNKDGGRHFYGGVIKGSSEKQKKLSFDLINYNEVLNYESDQYGYHDDFKDLLKHKIINVNGKYKITEVRNGFGWNSSDDADLGNEFYYRYSFNFWIGWLQLLSIIVIYLAMSYKSIRLEFELIVARVLAYWYSAEISGGEKIKKILFFIRDTYILLCVDVVCVKLYYIISGYLSKNSSIPIIACAFLCLFVAFAVIDGPNLVEQLLGMDAGLKSSTGRILALGHAAKTATGGLGSAARKARGIRNGDSNQGGFMGAVSGYAFGRNENRDLAGKGGLFGNKDKDKETSNGKGMKPPSENGNNSSNESGNNKNESIKDRDGINGEKGAKGDKGERGDLGNERFNRNNDNSSDDKYESGSSSRFNENMRNSYSSGNRSSSMPEMERKSNSDFYGRKK
ncbi:MAG: hypothetical protein SOR72_04370 [Hornefia sp.]|nr:hypothetical protein [Hornefia sp.]